MNVAQMVARKKAVLFDLFHTLTAIEPTRGQGLPFTFQVLGVSREAWDGQLNQCSRDRLTGRLRDPIEEKICMPDNDVHGRFTDAPP